jgi:hypothetical protein
MNRAGAQMAEGTGEYVLKAALLHESKGESINSGHFTILTRHGPEWCVIYLQGSK